MTNRRSLRLSTQFKKDFKKYRHDKKIRLISDEVIGKLQNNEQLEAKYCDHMLTGNWKGYRDCHVRPDCVLIYKIEGNELLLARIGSHSELFD